MDTKIENQLDIAQQSSTLLEENRELHDQVLALREASAQNQARNENADRLTSQFTVTLAVKEREKLELEEKIARLTPVQQHGQLERVEPSIDTEPVHCEYHSLRKSHLPGADLQV